MLYVLLFLCVFTAAAISIFFKKMRLYHFQRLAVKGMLKKKQAGQAAAFFSSEQIFKIVRKLLRKGAKRPLFYLCFGKTFPAEQYLRKNNDLFGAAILKAFDDYYEGIRLLQKITKQHPDNYEAEAELAELFFITGQKQKTDAVLQKIPRQRISSYVRAKKCYYKACLYLDAGNMLEASECAARAAKLFRREKAYVEEGKAYLLAGTIYRVSAVEDVAHFMFCQSRKIFSFLKYPEGEAEALGNLGMLWTMRENFTEAENCFRQSLKIYERCRPEAEGIIKNQLALLFLLQKDYSKAHRTATEAANCFQKHLFPAGTAFSLEIRAYIAYGEKKWKNLISLAGKAAGIYEKLHDVSAEFECLYLKSWGEYETGALTQAEKNLRKIISGKNNQSHCFHLGNAYNLLGLVFLKQNDLPRAKGLFLQSAALEQKDERFSGAAADYANIGLIEYRSGNTEQALKTYETALVYASAFSETEFSAFLRKRIESLKTELK